MTPEELLSSDLNLYIISTTTSFCRVNMVWYWKSVDSNWYKAGRQNINSTHRWTDTSLKTLQELTPEQLSDIMLSVLTT